MLYFDIVYLTTYLYLHLFETNKQKSCVLVLSVVN